jgi:hypothetical protein
MSYNSEEKMYLHINNGGISFDVESKDMKKFGNVYPILVIQASHFSYQTNQMKIPLTPNCLKELGVYLIKQSEKFSNYPDYIDELIKKPNLDKQLIKVLDHYISDGDFDQWGGSVNILDEYLDSKEFKNKFRLRIADYIDAPEVFKEIVDNKEFQENLREELLDQALRRSAMKRVITSILI